MRISGIYSKWFIYIQNRVRNLLKIFLLTEFAVVNPLVTKLSGTKWQANTGTLIVCVELTKIQELLKTF